MHELFPCRYIGQLSPKINRNPENKFEKYQNKLSLKLYGIDKYNLDKFIKNINIFSLLNVTSQ